MQQEIKEKELKNIEGTPLILDIRSNQDYNNLHLVQPHIHIPAANLDIPSFLKNTPLREHQNIYILSQHGDTSRLVAKRFTNAGLKNVINIKGGILKSRTDGIAMQQNKSLNLKRIFCFLSGFLIFFGVFLGLFVSKNFFIIPLGIGFLLIFQSIVGKSIVKYLKDNTHN